MLEVDTAGTERTSLIDIDATFLPLGRMRQICRVTHLEGSTIHGEVDVGRDHWVYPDHFPGDPIFPGTLMIEAAGQLVALWAWARGQRGHPRLVRTRADFHSPVGPANDILLLRAEVRGKKNLSFGQIGVWTGDVQVASLEAVLAVLRCT